VHLVEKVGQLLDLIQDDPVGKLGRNERDKGFGMAKQHSESFCFSQVEVDRLGESLSYPGGFAGGSRAKEKKTLISRRL
jgi:hypothetical protein